MSAAGEVETVSAEGAADGGAIASKPAVRRCATIQVDAGGQDQAATAGEAAIMAAGVEIYQRGPVLVRPVWYRVPSSNGRTTLAAGFGKLGAHALIDLFSQSARWVRYDSSKKKQVTIDPPISVAQVLLSREGQWNAPPIAGIVTCPTLRPDGSILLTPGYDEQTRLYLVPDADIRLLPAVAFPTRDDALAALDDLQTLFDEFPFEERYDGSKEPQTSLSVVLSAVITSVVRGAVMVSPLHVFSASTPGTGKSYLSDVIAAISQGRPCPVMRVSQDAYETEKGLAALIISGAPLISLDNVTGELGSDLLAQAVERPIVTIRNFGVLKSVEVESKSTVLATGNNITLRGDLIRRSVKARLNARMENPEEREFKGDPVATVLADRGRYVSACLIIVRAYLLAGSPGRARRLGSYNDWSDLIRSALIWLGCADPCGSMDATRADDPARGELRRVLAAWVGAIGLDKPVTVNMVVQRCKERVMVKHHGDYDPDQQNETDEYEYPALRDAVLDVAGNRDGSINPRVFGKWLSENMQRQVSGWQVVRAGEDPHSKVALWRVTAAPEPGANDPTKPK